MSVELVTGYAGAAHITAADDGEFNASVIGSGKYVLPYGDEFACTVIDNNTVRIGTGDALFEGRHVIVHNAEDVSIDSGTASLNRIDLVCIKYERDSITGVESASLAVIKGTAAATPSDPTVPSGSILSGAIEAYMPLWRIKLTGINIGTPESMYGDVMRTLVDAGTGTVAASRVSGTLLTSNIPNHSAAKITSGQLALARGGTAVDGSSIAKNKVFASPTSATGAASFRALEATDIPNIDAAKVASGTLVEERIPNISATKITSDTLDAARIPNLDASKITKGTLSAARGGTGASGSSVAANRVLASPNGSSGAVSYRALVAADIPNLAASKITSGTLATARGGTGADGSSVSANRVLASPNGSSGAVSYRALVAADIPNIAADKITSGTMSAARIGSGQLALARGGTGVDNTARTANTVFAAPNGAAGNASFRALVAADIPNLPASKITSGQLALARMPYYTLYSPSSGTTGDFTLSDSAANYTYIEVFYRTNDSVFSSVKISAPNNRTFCMQNIYIDSSANMYVKAKNMKISGTSVTNVGYAGHMVLHAGDEPTYQSTASEFYIYLVIGWK